jgi:two-component system, OmpR family, sensor histidine kinase VicK
MQPRFGIRSKLLLSILAILLVSYSTLMYSTMHTLNVSLRTEIERNLEANLKFARSQYFDNAEIVKHTLMQSAGAPTVLERMRARDGAWLTERLERWHRGLPFAQLMVVLDADKRVIARLNGAADGRPLALPGVVDQALAGRRVMVSTEIISAAVLCRSGVSEYCGKEGAGASADALVVTVVIPVIDRDGKLLGCMVTGDILNRYHSLPGKLQEVFGNDIEVTLTQQGVKIASSSSDDLAGSARLSPRVLDMLERGQVYRGQTIIGAKQYQTAIHPLFNSREELVGSLAVAVATERFKKIRQENLENILVSAFLGILCSFVLAFMASRRLTGPLRALAAGARRIEEGDLNQRVEESDDEVGTLAGSFNTMAQALKQRDDIITRKTADLEELNEQLERMVGQRTHALTMEMGRLEAVLTSMAEGVVVTDAENKVVLFNPAAQQMFELMPHRVIEQPIERVCELGGMSALAGPIRELMEPGSGNGSTHRLEVKGKRLNVYLCALTDENANFAGMVLSIRDVTMEEQVDRMKTDFISTVSHELKTPLTSMKGSLQLLLNRGKWLTETEKQLLTVCFRNTQRLIRLIGEILDISGIESGGMTFKFEPVSMCEITGYAVEEMQSYAMGRNITIVNSVSEQLPMVYGDSDRLIQVITNLLSNAVKFSPEGKVVMVTARQQENYVSVCVSDRGEVIQWADREKLFKKFQQLKSSDGKIGGTGLGLAICKEIVERHHGRIFYRASKEPGNTFCFTVPIIGEGDEKEPDSHS